jgi:N utilization substance protein B
MTRRSRAREVVLQLLFQHDMNPGVPREAIDGFLRERLREASLVAFATGLYEGTASQLPDIDARLTAAADNWRLARMTAVDRNVLRLGAYELLHGGDETPAAVALDEAIELARRYGSQDSPAFVNGVLDKINKSREPASPDPAPPE